jgi:hypothetical protein
MHDLYISSHTSVNFFFKSLVQSSLAMLASVTRVSQAKNKLAWNEFQATRRPSRWSSLHSGHRLNCAVGLIKYQRL